jgi:hypothetical protein
VLHSIYAIRKIYFIDDLVFLFHFFIFVNILMEMLRQNYIALFCADLDTPMASIYKVEDVEESIGSQDCAKYRRKNGQLDKSQLKLSNDVKGEEDSMSNDVEGEEDSMGDEVEGEEDSMSDKVEGEEDCTRNLIIAKYREKKLREAISHMIIMDEFPPSFVEGQGFQKFMKIFEPRFSALSRYTVMRDCVKLYLVEKENLRKMFLTTGQRVCFTTNIWTSVQNLDYMSITAHFIDYDWKLQKKIISFRQVQDHKEETIGRELEECLLEWSIDRILTITVDNAISNDTPIDWLKRRTLSWKETICGHEFIHMKCCAHILNLIVHEGLKDVDELIIKVRSLVKYVKSSPVRLDWFKSCVRRQMIQCNNLLCLDVPTQWNSTYIMLDVAEKFQGAFELMQVEEDEHLLNYHSDDGLGKGELEIPTCADWDTIRSFVKFLKKFYDVTLHMSGTSYATSNRHFRVLLGIHEHLKSYCQSGDMLLSNMAQRMKVKYDKYWGGIEKVNMLLFVAIVLDPRYKLVVVEFWFNQVFGTKKTNEIVGILRTDIDHLYEQYSKFGGCSSEVKSSVDVTQIEDSFLQEFHEFLASQNLIKCKSEIERYLIEDVEKPNAHIDILSWWKVNATKFPILARIARDVLAIPITAVAFESAFNIGGRVLDPFRSSLAPKTMEAIICAQNWLKPSPINLSQYLDEIEDANSYRLEAGNYYTSFKLYI